MDEELLQFLVGKSLFINKIVKLKVSGSSTLDVFNATHKKFSIGDVVKTGDGNFGNISAIYYINESECAEYVFKIDCYPYDNDDPSKVKVGTVYKTLYSMENDIQSAIYQVLNVNELIPIN